MSDIGERRNICASEQSSEVKKSKSNIKRPCDACEMASDGVMQRAKYRYMSSLFNSSFTEASTAHYDAKTIPVSIFKIGQEYKTNQFYFFITQDLNSELEDLVCRDISKMQVISRPLSTLTFGDYRTRIMFSIKNALSKTSQENHLAAIKEANKKLRLTKNKIYDYGQSKIIPAISEVQQFVNNLKLYPVELEVNYEPLLGSIMDCISSCMYQDLVFRFVKKTDNCN